MPSSLFKVDIIQTHTKNGRDVSILARAFLYTWVDLYKKILLIPQKMLIVATWAVFKL